MVFSWSGASGCNANNTDLATTNIRAEHINEARTAIEAWYTKHGEAIPNWTLAGTTPVATDVDRAAHLNEVRTAINKIRTTVTACACVNTCDCHTAQHNCGFGCADSSPSGWSRIEACQCNGNNTCCDGTFGCNCNQTCHCHVVSTSYTPLASFTWANDSGGNSSNASPVQAESIILAAQISKLRSVLDEINSRAANAYGPVWHNNLSFP